MASNICGDLARDREWLRMRSATPRIRDPKLSLMLPWPRRCMGEAVDARSMEYGNCGNELGAWDKSDAVPLVAVAVVEAFPSIADLPTSDRVDCMYW